MNYKRENLIKLLELIDEISGLPSNEWFLEELHKKYSTGPNVQSLDYSSLEAKINLIRDYLSIDVPRLIDYSLFEEPARESLFRDCIEMGRFEKGTPNHKIDFGEFCRYGHLQCEELLNYFYNKVTNKNINKIFEFICDSNPKYKPAQPPKEVHHIPFAFKLKAFKNIAKIKYEDIIQFLNEFRNEKSHRNSLAIDSEDKTLVEFEQAGFVKNSYVDTKEMDEKLKNVYYKGKYIIKKRKENFGEIYITIEELKSVVIQALNTTKELPSLKQTFGNINPALSELKNKLV